MTWPHYRPGPAAANDAAPTAVPTHTLATWQPEPRLLLLDTCQRSGLPAAVDVLTGWCDDVLSGKPPILDLVGTVVVQA
jgi:hypothetical protein